jgi:hypothetical protein
MLAIAISQDNQEEPFRTQLKKQTPRLQSASELYRPSDRPLSAKLVPTSDTAIKSK